MPLRIDLPLLPRRPRQASNSTFLSLTATSEIQGRVLAHTRRLSNTAAFRHLPAYRSVPLSLVAPDLNLKLASRNLHTDSRPHIAMSYRSPIAWKTPLTHTPHFSLHVRPGS